MKGSFLKVFIENISLYVPLFEYTQSCEALNLILSVHFRMNLRGSLKKS